MMKNKKGHAIAGEICCECGGYFRDGETITEIWSTLFGLVGKKHRNSKTCEKNLRNRVVQK